MDSRPTVLHRYLAPMPVWRSVDTWPRRDSFLLGGLLLLADYVLAIVIIFLDLNGWGVIAVLAALLPLAVYTLAEFAHGIRPTEASLARADRLALFAVAMAFLITGSAILIGLLSGGLN